MSRRKQGKAREEERPDRSGLASPVIAVLAVVVTALVVRNGFAQDDIAIIQESTRLHDFGAWREILTLPYWPPPASPDLYRPVTSLWLALQYVIGDGNPVVYHVVSMLLFAATAVILYRLARLLLPPVPAFVAAALFAAHPLHVEPVTLAVGQAELIVGLLALICATKYIVWRRSAGALSMSQWAWLVLMYGVAGLSKENGLVIPALLLCAELLIEAASFRERFRALWKGYVALGTAGTGIILIRSAVLGHVAASMAADAIREASFPSRVLTMLRTAPQWFRLFAWPAHLRAEYSPQEFVPSTGFGPMEAAGLGLLVAALVAAVRFRKSTPAASFAIGWTAIALLPVANVIVPTGILIGERTLFLASVGPCLLLGVLVASILDAFEGRSRIHQVIYAICAMIVVAAGVRSVSRFRVWKDNRTLTLYSMTDAPRSWRVQQSYAELLFDDGRVADGWAAYDRAVQYAPEKWRPRNRFAERLLHIGRDEEALEQLQKSLAEYPGRIETLIRMPAALLAVGEYRRARDLADSIIVAQNSPPLMVAYRIVADSAMKLKARPGSVRVFPF